MLRGRGRANRISLRSLLLLRGDRDHPSLTINMTYDLSWLRDRDLLRLEIELRSSLLCKLLLLRLLLMDRISRSTLLQVAIPGIMIPESIV